MEIRNIEKEVKRSRGKSNVRSRFNGLIGRIDLALNENSIDQRILLIAQSDKSNSCLLIACRCQLIEQRSTESLVDCCNLSVRLPANRTRDTCQFVWVNTMCQPPLLFTSVPLRFRIRLNSNLDDGVASLSR